MSLGKLLANMSSLVLSSCAIMTEQLQMAVLLLLMEF